MNAPTLTARRGLTAAEVLASRAQYGSNALTAPPRDPWWKLYFEKFDDPVIRILVIAAAIAIAVGAIDGHLAEGVGIIVAILLATFLSFWNEYRAAKEFDLLNTTSDDLQVKVLRENGYLLVPRREVVVGDLVFVEVGEEVPADGILLEAHGLLVDESKLTGESHAMSKQDGDRLARGTSIVDGYGLMQVDAVGDATEIGTTLRASVMDTGEQTPLNLQLARLSNVIGLVGFSVALLVFAALFARGLSNGALVLQLGEWVVVGALLAAVAVALAKVWLPIVRDLLAVCGWRRSAQQRSEQRSDAPGSWLVMFIFGIAVFAVLTGIGVATGLVPRSVHDWLSLSDVRQLLRNFMIAVTIIVVAVPEGLAMSVTLSLAYSIRKMTASQTLVRRMHACETIGAATVICSDKTGTLTRNEMRLARAVFFGRPLEKLPERGLARQLVIEAMAANSTAQLSQTTDRPAEAVGNPTESALLFWLDQHGVNYAAAREAFALREQWLFNTERKFMASLGTHLHVKGAPEIVLGMCQLTADGDSTCALDDARRAQILAEIAENQRRGMRTLGFAYRPVPHSAASIEQLAEDLIWLGWAALSDPVRAEVPAAIQACQTAGVQVKIITGDSAETAAEIARQAGMPPGGLLVSGAEFAQMDEEHAAAAAKDLSVLARARPADKLRLVRLLKSQGHVVAVTGDGVNDGPALNHADVGLAMGRSGTAVAREASDIILLDDSFASIVKAIRWGRTLYENIQRFILFQLTINVAALSLAVLGPFVGFELPLTVMQMLWINLIMDTFAALALATEPPHDQILLRPPRSPDAFIVTPRMAAGIFGTAAAFLAIMLTLMLGLQHRGDLQGDAATRGSTLLFTTFVLLQFWNLFNAKAMGRDGPVLWKLGNNPSFLLIAAVIFLGQVLLVHFGGKVFRTVPLDVLDWAMLVAGTSCVFWVGELMRWVAARRQTAAT